MSVPKPLHSAAVSASAPSRLPNRKAPAEASASGVDTSNLSPGAAARFEKLMRSLDSFTAGVYSKAITLPERK